MSFNSFQTMVKQTLSKMTNHTTTSRPFPICWVSPTVKTMKRMSRMVWTCHVRRLRKTWTTLSGLRTNEWGERETQTTFFTVEADCDVVLKLLTHKWMCSSNNAILLATLELPKTDVKDLKINICWSHFYQVFLRDIWHFWWCLATDYFLDLSSFLSFLPFLVLDVFGALVDDEEAPAAWDGWLT